MEIERHTLRTGNRGLCLAVVADTHARPHPASTERIAALEPDRILHAGDIGDRAVLDRLATVAPVLAVRGNIDAPSLGPDALTVDLIDGQDKRLRLLLVHIAVYGTKLRREVVQLAQKEGASLVVCGHSHVPFIGRDRELAIFNPGSIGPRRFQLPIVFGVIDVHESGLSMRHVDAESGETWQPHRA